MNSFAEDVKTGALIFENETNIDWLVFQREVLIEKKEYLLAKAANERIASLEVERGCLTYMHLPIVLHVELTSMCNCACIMCTHAYECNDRASYLDMNLVKPFLPTCRLAVINGIGEPFLHPRIKEILELFAEYDVKISTTSNMQVLKPELIPYISKQFRRISISCDGAEPKTYEYIRRGCSFATFVDNVKRLRPQCPNTWFHMAVTIMRQNIEEASELVKLAKNLGFDEVRFGRLETNPLLENEMDSLLYYPDVAAEELQKAKDVGRSLGIAVNIPRIFETGFDRTLSRNQRELLHAKPYFKEANFYKNLHKKFSSYNRGIFVPDAYALEKAAPCSGICHWLVLGVNINVHGQLRPCGEIIRDMGVKLDSGMLEKNVLNIPEIVALRELYLEGFIPSVCANCSYLLSNETSSIQVDGKRLKEYLLNEKRVKL